MANPDNFSLEEYLQILDLQENELNKETLEEKVKVYVEQYPNSQMFFYNLKKKLLSIIESKNQLSEELKTKKNRIRPDRSIKELTDLPEEKLEEALETMDEDELMEKLSNAEPNALLDKKQFAIAQKRSKYIKNYIPGIPQGDLNQTRREFFIRTINFDSKYRKIPDINSIVCAQNVNTQTKSELENELKTNIAKIREPSTDYTIQLAIPISNVVEMTLQNLEIPVSWYVFDDDYGTDYFVYSKIDPDDILKRRWEKFDIPPGSYNEQELVDILNTRSIELDSSLNFVYTSTMHKITVENTGTQDIIIDWASGMHTPAACFGGAKGQKIDSSMGWIFGFRSRIIEIKAGDKKHGTALLDLEGTKYFLLVLDDFVNSKPNQDLITMIGAEKDTSFRLPKYWNKQTMEDNCNVITFPDPLSSCGNTPVNRDLSSNLTKNQKYTVEQIKLKMQSEEINTYKAPASSDVLARISITKDRMNRYGSQTYLNSNYDYTKRMYFGPVSLSKFRIKLLNDKGYIVNLNNMDWSFSILVKQRYQHT
tara:strand:- start:112 stop:1722 length:1611 start_codon:yes stop_codon:yes gene_type:complete